MSKKDSLANKGLSPTQAKTRKAGWKPPPDQIFSDDAVADMSRRMDSYTDEEIAAAAERARLRALSTPDPVALPKLPQVKPDEKKPKKQGPGRGRRPKYDREEIRRMYMEDEMSPTLIADALGTTIRTVIDNLKKMEVYEPGKNSHTHKKPGKAPSDTCQRGHDMNIHARTVWRMTTYGVRVRDGRECTECIRMRQRGEI